MTGESVGSVGKKSRGVRGRCGLGQGGNDARHESAMSSVPRRFFVRKIIALFKSWPPLKGGNFHFGVHGDHSEPFLLHVCGVCAEEWRKSLRNLIDQNPHESKVVFDKIASLAAVASAEKQNIPKMPMSSWCKQCKASIYGFRISLGSVAKDVWDANHV